MIKPDLQYSDCSYRKKVMDSQTGRNEYRDPLCLAVNAFGHCVGMKPCRTSLSSSTDHQHSSTATYSFDILCFFLTSGYCKCWSNYSKWAPSSQHQQSQSDCSAISFFMNGWQNATEISQTSFQSKSHSLQALWAIQCLFYWFYTFLQYLPMLLLFVPGFASC